MSQLSKKLLEGLALLDLSLNEIAQQQILAYLQLLQQWSRVHNLISKANDEVVLAQHILDSLAVVPHLDGERLLDVGSGAGLPGILIAIACPDKSVTLLEPREKRVAFLRAVVSRLSLNNIVIICDRIENYHPDTLFDGVIARAFTRLAKLIDLSRHVLLPTGFFYLMEGVAKPKEYERANDQFIIIPLRVPFLTSQRHLIRSHLQMD